MMMIEMMMTFVLPSHIFFLIIIMSNTCSYSSVHWVKMETALYLLVATVNCGTTAQ